MRWSIRFVTLMVIASLGIILPPAFGTRAAPTGYSVSDTFSEFYQRSGGLPIFGFAVGPVVHESGRPVQYFERQRFEYHSELSGSPYEVLLGRLGVFDAEKRGLLSHSSFAPLAETAPTKADCLYFAETGHQLCHGFLNYWKNHGLEFGDDGVSQRESLALHGFPISEEFVDPESGLTVQYFERARFEYHPENAGTEFSVLLGRLGDPLWADARNTTGHTPENVQHQVTTSQTPVSSQSPANSIIWQADNETGDLSQWTIGQYGEAAFNSGTGITSVTDTVARSGRHALQLSISQVNGTADQGARIFRWNDPNGKPLPKSAYYSAWLYIPELVDSPDWWNLFQFKSKSNNVSDPMWLLTATSGRDGQLRLELWDALERRSYAPSVDRPLPIGRWVHVEAYFNAATDRSGSVIIWLDGAELVRAEGVRTTTADNVQWSLNNYANRLSPSTVTVYWDDAVIATQRQGPGS